jgi:hypothetical protein
MPTFDQFVVAATVLVIVVGGMRLFYGAWPWEVSKTWYRTREAVHYVEALRVEKCNPTLRPVRETVETARAVPLVQDVVGTNSDSFDRAVVYGSSPAEVSLPTEEFLASLQKVKRRWLNSRNQPIIQLQKTERTTDGFGSVTQ